MVSLELTRPSLRLARSIHHFWLFHVIPFAGRFISGHRGAYMYLPKSIEDFPPPEEIERVMRGAGLINVQTYSLALGAATVHRATK